MDNPLMGQNGTKRWYKGDRLHREDGPAIIFPDGSEMWYRNGKLHREDGPAVIYPSGIMQWRLNGKSYFFNEYCDELKLSNEDQMILRIRYG